MTAGQAATQAHAERRPAHRPAPEPRPQCPQKAEASRGYAQVCCEPIVSSQLLGDLQRELLVQTALHVDEGKPVQIGLGLPFQLALLLLDVCVLRVAL